MADNVRVNYGKLLRRILLYFVVVFICLFILYPYFVMVCTALKSRAEIFAMEGTIFPKVAMWPNFVDIWQKAPMAKYMLNSVIIAGGSTLGHISLTQVSIPTADIGLPQLAMHSCYETAGVRDALDLEKTMAEFYSITASELAID